MKTRVKCTIALACLVILLPLLIGCGGGGTDQKTEIVLGWIGDATGPAQSAIMPIFACLEDYLKKVDEENLLPGIRLKVITYDTRTDYGRVPVGYSQMKDRGADLLLIPNQGEIEVIATKLAGDKLPAITVSASQPLLGHDWVFFMGAALEDQVEVIMKWIVENWDYSGTSRNPKVGHVGTDSLVGASHRAGIDQYLAANPGKVDWLGHKASPVSTTSWAAEITPFMTADYVVISMVGPGTATYIKEARTKGLQAELISGTSSVPGYWNLIQSAVPANQLNDLYHMHYVPWVGDNPFAQGVEALIREYRSQSYADAQLNQASYQVGYAWGIWLVDIIQRAVDAVGLENLDGEAIREAIVNTDLVVEGWGNRWTLSEENHLCAPTMIMYKWSVEDSEWQTIGDWISPN